DLTRFPEDPRERLRAWDASDEYLLRELDRPSGRVVVFGDRWGALTTSLLSAGVPVTQVSDSYLAQQATLANVARNGVSQPDLVLAPTVGDFSRHFVSDPRHSDASRQVDPTSRHSDSS